MSAGHTVTITPSDAHVEVRLGGELLAATDKALRLDETGLPARYYIPKSDVRMDLLEATSFHTTCPFKGEASYWRPRWAASGTTASCGPTRSRSLRRPTSPGICRFYPDRTEISVDGEALTS